MGVRGPFVTVSQHAVFAAPTIESVEVMVATPARTREVQCAECQPPERPADLLHPCCSSSTPTATRREQDCHRTDPAVRRGRIRFVRAASEPEVARRCSTELAESGQHASPWWPPTSPPPAPRPERSDVPRGVAQARQSSQRVAYCLSGKRGGKWDERGTTRIPIPRRSTRCAAGRQPFKPDRLVGSCKGRLLTGRMASTRVSRRRSVRGRDRTVRTSRGGCEIVGEHMVAQPPTPCVSCCARGHACRSRFYPQPIRNRAASLIQRHGIDTTREILPAVFEPQRRPVIHQPGISEHYLRAALGVKNQAVLAGPRSGQSSESGPAGAQPAIDLRRRPMDSAPSSSSFPASSAGRRGPRSMIPELHGISFRAASAEANLVFSSRLGAGSAVRPRVRLFTQLAWRN
jgi:hypothetical protein